MARTPTEITKRGNDEFTAEENAVALLLAGFPSDRSEWSHDMATEVANIRAMSLFFCPLMILMKNRGKTIQKRCDAHPTLRSLKVQRRPINTLARGDAVTLDMILHVHKVLDAIKDCDDKEIRAITRIDRRKRDVCLTFEENDVIPSHFWVDRARITEFRSHFNLGPRKLAGLMFGSDSKYDLFFETIETGEKIGDVEYDFRVTAFTRDCILFLMNTLFEEMGGYRPPSVGEIFQASSKAGLGAYNRTKALPIWSGNLTRAMTPEHKNGIKDRVMSFAKSAPKKTKRKAAQKST